MPGMKRYQHGFDDDHVSDRAGLAGPYRKRSWQDLQPMVFTKFPSSVTGPYNEIELP